MSFYSIVLKMDSVLIISLATIFSGIAVLALKLCFKSKCSDVNVCFGVLQFQRDVSLENEIEIQEPKTGDKSNKDLNINNNNNI